MTRTFALAGLVGGLAFTDAVRAVTPPTISVQPISQAVNGGAAVTFRVTFTASPAPAFQWRFGDSDLPGATNAALSLTNVQASNTGSYVVTLTNVAGVAISRAARLDLVSGFTRVTAAPVATAGLAAGAAWSDYDGDGFPDLFTTGDANRLYLNNRDGTFTEVTKTADVSGRIDQQGSGIWGDFDNDGHLDLFVPDAGGRSALFRNLGAGTFTNVSPASLTNFPGVQGRAWADYDNDGNLDLFLVNGNSGANDFLFHGNGDGTFTAVTDDALLKKTGSAQGCAWGDYDNDGLVDLAIAGGAGRGGRNRLFHNDGNGQFRPLTNNVTAETAGTTCAWGDYNNDGFLDLFVGNNATGNSLFRNNGDGTFTKVVNDSITQDTPRNAPDCAWADFDNDGWLDLLVLNAGLGSPTPPYLYHNNGDGTFSKVTTGKLVTTGVDGSGGGCAWADYDHDGFPDLFQANYFNGLKNFLWHNDGNSNAWLSIHCEGRVSNRAAIGAKVRVRARLGGRDVWQMREISGGHGFASQNDLTALFGLGEATQADVIRIEWPSGIVQTLTDVAARQFLEVKEPSLLLPAGAKPSEGALILRGGKGLSYQIQTSADLRNWENATILTNLSGTVQFQAPGSSDLPGKFVRALERD